MPENIIEENKYWTEVITPRNKFFDLRLKEVWQYRDLIVLFVKRDMAAQYKQTILGPLWYLIQPAFTTFMFFLLFNQIANISTAPLNPVLFYMSSITIWNYFSSCLNNTSNTFISNAGIFGKVYFPRLVLPLSSVLSNMARFGIQLGLLITLTVYYAVTGQLTFSIGWHTLLIPVIVAIMAGMGLGLGIIISSLTTKYRDLSVLISFGVQLLMYITPVAYPLSYLKEHRPTLFAYIQWNPLSPMVEDFRYAIFGTGSFETGPFMYSIAFTLVVLFTGILLFNKVERSFMDTV